MGVAKSASHIYGLSNFLGWHQPDYRVLMYHSIGSRVIRDPSNMYSVDEYAFRKQMEYLASTYSGKVLDFSVGSFKELANSLMVTFDDGYKDNLHVAAPILEEFEIPYTVFVSTQYIKDNNNNFLSKSELRQLSNMPGANIGSHGVTHASLAQCNDKNLKAELTDSKHYIEDVIGKEVMAIAYPSGSVDQRVVDAAKLSGYQLGGTSYNNRNNISSNKLFLARTCIFGIDSITTFKQKVRGDWDWLKYIQKPPKITF